MGSLWPRSSSLEWDDNGKLAEGALAYFYEANTTTPKAVYQNGGESSAHEFPVEADGGRWPAVFVPFGSYKFIIKTAGGTTLFSADNIPNEAPNDTEVTVDEDALYQTGDYIIVGKNGTRSGAVRCNGRTIGDAASGGTERANADCADLYAYIWDNYDHAIISIFDSAGSASTFGASAGADFAAHKRLPMPDHRSAGIIGLDNMGNSNAGLSGSIPIVTGSALFAGSIIGENTHVLTIVEQAAHNHSVNSNTTGITAAANNHTTGLTVNSNTTGITAGANSNTTGITLSNASSQVRSLNAVLNLTASGALGDSVTIGVTDPGHTHTVSITDGGHIHAVTDGGHTHTVSVTDGGHNHTTNTSGSDTPHNIVSRCIPVTILMKL